MSVMLGRMLCQNCCVSDLADSEQSTRFLLSTNPGRHPNVNTAPPRLRDGPESNDVLTLTATSRMVPIEKGRAVLCFKSADQVYSHACVCMCAQDKDEAGYLFPSRCLCGSAITSRRCESPHRDLRAKNILVGRCPSQLQSCLGTKRWGNRRFWRRIIRISSILAWGEP